MTPGGDANGNDPLSLGAYWGGVTPLVLISGDQFRAPPPPLPGTPEYVAAFNEVEAIGASTDTPGSTSTARTRFIGNYWGYDATPLLGTPPRLFNQIAVQVAKDQRMTDPEELARYLAMINTALGDAGIAAWDTKYYYTYWRPVTGVRRQSEMAGSGVTGNPTWKPVGASVINTTAPIVATPPFPAYVSGHATFAGATFGLMRKFFTNNTRFTFVSDEYSGEGTDPFGVPRPLVPVRYRSLQQAQEERGISRIYNGVHWQYDNIEGQVIGQKIAD